MRPKWVPIFSRKAPRSKMMVWVGLEVGPKKVMKFEILSDGLKGNSYVFFVSNPSTLIHRKMFPFPPVKYSSRALTKTGMEM